MKTHDLISFFNNFTLYYRFSWLNWIFSFPQSTLISCNTGYFPLKKLLIIHIFIILYESTKCIAIGLHFYLHVLKSTWTYDKQVMKFFFFFNCLCRKLVCLYTIDDGKVQCNRKTNIFNYYICFLQFCKIICDFVVTYYTRP